MKITRTGTSHYLKTATPFLPSGTVMFHYAVSGTKEELEAYEEVKADKYSEFDKTQPNMKSLKDEYNGKPFHCSAKILCDADSSIEVELRNGNLSPVETDEQRVAKTEERIAKAKADKEREKKFALAAKLGMAFSG